MAQPLRQEDSTTANLLTTRTENSRLWFVNNADLEYEILAALARYQCNHGVMLYAFVLQGNHDHLTSTFPNANRAMFMRDLNAQIARLCKRLIPEVGRGKFWERRYASQELPRNEDIEEYFFYCALQAVHSGLSERPEHYPGYNSFIDAITGTEREFVHTDWVRYKNARRYNPHVDISRYQTTYRLKYSRLPGYEHLSQEDYRNLMLKKLEDRRLVAVEKRMRSGKSFPDPKTLRQVKPGSQPKSTKQSTRYSKRPLVLCGCPETRNERLSSYFSLVSQYKDASARYLRGDLSAPFPPGTYRPPLLCLLH